MVITCFKENIVNYLRKLLLWKYIWEVADFLHGPGKLPFGNCHLGKCTFGKLLLGKLHIHEVATWENTLGKLPLGKRPLGKYLTSIYQCVQYNISLMGTGQLHALLEYSTQQ